MFRTKLSLIYFFLFIANLQFKNFLLHKVSSEESSKNKFLKAKTNFLYFSQWEINIFCHSFEIPFGLIIPAKLRLNKDYGS